MTIRSKYVLKAIHKMIQNATKRLSINHFSHYSEGSSLLIVYKKRSTLIKSFCLILIFLYNFSNIFPIMYDFFFQSSLTGFLPNKMFLRIHRIKTNLIYNVYDYLL